MNVQRLSRKGVGMNNPETGGNLDFGENTQKILDLAQRARDWFICNKIKVPENAVAWQKSSVTRKEIPPGTGIGTLRRLGTTARIFISLINKQDISLDLYNRSFSSILKDHKELEEELGFLIVEETFSSTNHKKLLVSCVRCHREEWLDYGTLNRMYKSKNKYCRYCRNAGGKAKEKGCYNIFEGMECIKVEDKVLSFSCSTCKTESTISMAYFSQLKAEQNTYKCPECHPRFSMATKISDSTYGDFDSTIEYNCYLTLVALLKDPGLIQRQVLYRDICPHINTKHSTDFYIPSLDLILEVTSSNNNISKKYQATKEWKMSIDKRVVFAHSPKEVEDIVRPLLKDKGLTVNHS